MYEKETLSVAEHERPIVTSTTSKIVYVLGPWR